MICLKAPLVLTVQLVLPSKFTLPCGMLGDKLDLTACNMGCMCVGCIGNCDTFFMDVNLATVGAGHLQNVETVYRKHCIKLNPDMCTTQHS